MGKFVAPTLSSRSFNCPHCDVLASQTWYDVLIRPLSLEHLPFRLSGTVDDNKDLWDISTDADEAKTFVENMLSKQIFMEKGTKGTTGYEIQNLDISKCFNCKQFTIWSYDAIIWPRLTSHIEINSDIPLHIATDIREAASIVERSPRGAAALLRLSLQQLCEHLGGKGRNINDDIGYLVDRGLDKRIQKALDIVRVIGNNAVHPGVIDLRDDRQTAQQLFKLMNLIADRMITEPRQIDELYEQLPEGARKKIEERDSGK